LVSEHPSSKASTLFLACSSKRRRHGNIVDFTTTRADFPRTSMSSVAARALVTPARCPCARSRRTRRLGVFVATARRDVWRPRAVARDDDASAAPPDRSSAGRGAAGGPPRFGKGGCFVDHCDETALASSRRDGRSGDRGSVEREGCLAGLTFAVKDNMDVRGARTGAGSPRWLETHPSVAHEHAPVVEAFLRHGARLVGKTQMDELAWALQGENEHYGAPINPSAPSRIPGGSSSGSACAVAGGFCDLALGTDTAGSVRVPAAYCGVFGFRPTHGVVSSRGVVPLAPSFDTVGWFARDARALQRAGDAALPSDGVGFVGFARDDGGGSGGGARATMLIAEDAFEACDAASRDVLRSVIQKFASRRDVFGDSGAAPPSARLGGSDGDGVPSAPPLTEWWDAFRTLQVREVWEALGVWIESDDAIMGSFGPGVRDRFEAARRAAAEAANDPEKEKRIVADAVAVRLAARARIEALLAKGTGFTVLVMPSAPGPPIARASAEGEVEAFRASQLRLTCASGFSGCPQAQIPAGTVDGAPVGISLLSARGTDKALLALVRELTE